MESQHQQDQEDVSIDLGMLLELVQTYEHLYNLGHKDYKNVNKKEESWKEIAAILGLSADECKRQWKNARDRFLRERRGRPSGSQAPESSWPYFDKMLFYVKYSKPRKTSTATAKKSYERPRSACSTVSVWSTVEAALSPTEPLSPHQLEDKAEENAAQESGSETPVSNIGYRKTVSLKRKRKEIEELSGIVTAAKQIAESLTSRAQPPNANKTFSEYVFSRLQEMEPEVAKAKRREMILILES